jgi:hypothetical protein
MIGIFLKFDTIFSFAQLQPRHFPRAIRAAARELLVPANR